MDTFETSANLLQRSLPNCTINDRATYQWIYYLQSNLERIVATWQLSQKPLIADKRLFSNIVFEAERVHQNEPESHIEQARLIKVLILKYIWPKLVIGKSSLNCQSRNAVQCDHFGKPVNDTVERVDFLEVIATACLFVPPSSRIRLYVSAFSNFNFETSQSLLTISEMYLLLVKSVHGLERLLIMDAMAMDKNSSKSCCLPFVINYVNDTIISKLSPVADYTKVVDSRSNASKIPCPRFPPTPETSSHPIPTNLLQYLLCHALPDWISSAIYERYLIYNHLSLAFPYCRSREVEPLTNNNTTISGRLVNNLENPFLGRYKLLRVDTNRISGLIAHSAKNCINQRNNKRAFIAKDISTREVVCLKLYLHRPDRFDDFIERFKMQAVFLFCQNSDAPDMKLETETAESTVGSDISQNKSEDQINSDEDSDIVVNNTLSFPPKSLFPSSPHHTLISVKYFGYSPPYFFSVSKYYKYHITLKSFIRDIVFSTSLSDTKNVCESPSRVLRPTLFPEVTLHRLWIELLTLYEYITAYAIRHLAITTSNVLLLPSNAADSLNIKILGWTSNAIWSSKGYDAGLADGLAQFQHCQRNGNDLFNIACVVYECVTSKVFSRDDYQLDVDDVSRTQRDKLYEGIYVELDHYALSEQFTQLLSSCLAYTGTSNMHAEEDQPCSCEGLPQKQDHTHHSYSLSSTLAAMSRPLSKPFFSPVFTVSTADSSAATLAVLEKLQPSIAYLLPTFFAFTRALAVCMVQKQKSLFYRTKQEKENDWETDQIALNIWNTRDIRCHELFSGALDCCGSTSTAGSRVISDKIDFLQPNVIWFLYLAKHYADICGATEIPSRSRTNPSPLQMEESTFAEAVRQLRPLTTYFPQPLKVCKIDIGGEDATRKFAQKGFINCNEKSKVPAEMTDCNRGKHRESISQSQGPDAHAVSLILDNKHITSLDLLLLCRSIHLMITTNRPFCEEEHANEPQNPLPQLTSISLANNFVGERTATESSHSLRYEGILAFSRLLVVSPPFNKITLLHLDLQGNRLGPVCAKILALGLVTCIHLETLNLRNTSIMPEGAVSVSAALRPLRQLQHIDLSGAEIGDEGCKAFANAIVTDTSTIKTMKLSFNNIAEIGGWGILEALRNNFSLTDLCLSNNPISSSQWKSDVLTFEHSIPEKLEDSIAALRMGITSSRCTLLTIIERCTFFNREYKTLLNKLTTCEGHNITLLGEVLKVWSIKEEFVKDRLKKRFAVVKNVTPSNGVLECKNINEPSHCQGEANDIIPQLERKLAEHMELLI